MTTVYEAFEELLHRIELNPTRVELASQRYNAVKRTIESALRGKTVRQIGSFQRRTKTRPNDLSDALDVDAVVSFGDAYNFGASGEGITPARALQIVRSALVSNETYRVMEPTTDAPVVVLEYRDKFKIELAAAYVDKMGGRSHGQNGPYCYLVAGEGDTWLHADYDYDSEVITGLNQASFVQKSLVPFIKIAKTYLTGMDVQLKSFHVEVLVALTIPSKLLEWYGKGYAWGYHHLLACFLEEAQSLLNVPLQLPGSFSDPVDSNLSMLDTIALSEWMKKKSQEAWNICRLQKQSEYEAIKAWRSFFGSPFPTV